MWNQANCGGAGRLALALWLVLQTPASAAVITVSGSCSLVEAIENAEDDDATNPDCAAGSGADEIHLTADVTLTAVDNTTSDGPNGLPYINSEITIEGNGFTIARDASAPSFRVFYLAHDGALILKDTTVSGGISERGGAAYVRGMLSLDSSTISGNAAYATDASVYGGGIVVFSAGSLNLTDSTISGNTAYGVPGARGGGIAFRGYGIVELVNSTVSGNEAAGSQYAGGGGIFQSTPGSTLILTDSTVSGNTVSGSKYMSAGGGIAAGTGATYLTGTTVSGNTVTAGGTSASAYGGGISANNTLTLTNSTVSGNSVTATHAGIGGGINTYTGTTTLYNTTVSGNSAYGPFRAWGGGVYNGPYSTLTLADSLVGHSTGGNCYGSITDSSNNLADDTTCGTVPGTLTNLEPTLADNGGPTLTHALSAGSSAIDNAGACGLATDQRSAPRFDGACDSGAFEHGGCPLLELESRTVTETETWEECEIHAGPDLLVQGPGGELTLTVGKALVLFEGFEVHADAAATLGFDPSLQLRAAIEAAERSER